MPDPNNGHPLYRRLVGLLTDHACALPGCTAEGLPRRAQEQPARPVVVQLAEPGDPCRQATLWLDQANPAFGGVAPRRYLAGTDEQLQYLERVIAAIEEGAFS